MHNVELCCESMLFGDKCGHSMHMGTAARSTGGLQDSRYDHDRPRRSDYLMTHPYQRWLGTGPSSRYTILIRLR
jgi:hypothetical protein